MNQHKAIIKKVSERIRKKLLFYFIVGIINGSVVTIVIFFWIKFCLLNL